MRSILIIWLTITLLAFRILSTDNLLIKNSELPIESPFQTIRWYQCWPTLCQALLQHVPLHVAKMILAYLTFTPTICLPDQNIREGALSRNGYWFVAIPSDDRGTLYLFDLASGHRVRTFRYNQEMESCAISHNGFLAMGGGKNDIVLWNTSSEELVTTLTGHTDLVWSCQFFLNDTQVVSGSWDTTVRIWKIEPAPGICLRILETQKQVLSVCVSENNTMIASKTDDNKTLQMWNSETGESLYVLNEHADLLYNHPCVFSADNRWFGSITISGETKVWDVSTGACVRTMHKISTNTNRIFCIRYLSEKHLVWWTRDRLGVWDFEKNMNAYEIPFNTTLRFVGVSGNGKYIITVSDRERKNTSPSMQLRILETGEIIN